MSANCSAPGSQCVDVSDEHTNLPGTESSWSLRSSLWLMPTGDGSTPIDTFESDRHFQIWRYEVGHAQLLLRSVKDDHHASRIDVLFKTVKAIDLPTRFDGLQIERDG